jgi:alpha-1,2-mannosyltransferase
MNDDYGRRSMRWLLIALATCALVNFAIVAFVASTGESRDQAMSASGLSLTPDLLKRTYVDSIRPMATAYLRQLRSGDMYWVFLVEGIKFQYPPSSLLLMKLLPLPLTIYDIDNLLTRLSVTSFVAMLLTIGFAIALWLKLVSVGTTGPVAWRKPNNLVAILLISILGITFYPLAKGHTIGQIQVYLGALSAAALLLQEVKSQALSGACLALCCLVKPQFGVVVLWALLRREKRFLWGFGIILVAGLCLSIYEFGLNNHFQYLEVLRRLSRGGETYWPNQSVNGFLNRFLQNGDAIVFWPFALAPFHPVVYYTTMISSVLIVVLALFTPAAASLKGRSLDLAVMICAATMASPIAWEHHYGVFFPIFAIALVMAVRSSRSGLLLLVSYGLVANELVRPNLVFANRWTGILGSHIFFGALLLFGLLLTMRYRGTGSEPSDITLNVGKAPSAETESLANSA